MDKIAVEAALAGAFETGCRGEWVMNVGSGEIQKERFVFLFSDPFHRAFRQKRARFLVVVDFVSLQSTAESVGALDGRFCRKRGRGGHGFAAVHQRIAWVVSEDAVIVDIDVGAAAVDQWHTKVVIKPDVLRSRPQWHLPIVGFFFESQMPFPETGCCVAFVLEDLSDRLRVRVDDQTGSGPQTP